VEFVAPLPPLMCFHLMRFTFCYQTMRRIKIDDPMSIPETLDLSFLLGGSPELAEAFSASGENEYVARTLPLLL